MGEEDLVLDTEELFLEREPFLDSSLDPMPVSLLSDPLLVTSEKTGSDCTRGRDGGATAIVGWQSQMTTSPLPWSQQHVFSACL